MIKSFAFAIVLVLIWIIMFGLVVLGNRMFDTGSKMYNCSIAEISPDFTPAMREECRSLQKNRYDTSR